MFRYLPEQASDFAENVDWIHNLITDLSVFFTVAIVGSMIYFAIRYRQKNGINHETPQIKGSHFLEFVWTVVPTIISIIIAYYGIIYHRQIRTPPADAMTINVVASQWKWDFEYENGKKIPAAQEFVVPVNKPVRLVMTSTDVLHSFFIPTMRVKQDVIPEEYTYLWFRPIKTGLYQSFCTEYCGKDHSAMLTKLRVVSQGEYDRWVNDRSEEIRMSSMSPKERGRVLFSQKQCNACHSLNGTRVVGPSFLKVYGAKEKMSDGQTITVDENYIKESILTPNAKLVEGFPPNIMPSFAGQLNDADISSLIAFIKSIDGSEPAQAQAASTTAAPKKLSADELAKLSPAERGKMLYSEKICITCHSIDGSKLVGPSFKGVYGRKGKLQDGSDYEANEAYIKNSILNPMSQVVKDYPPAMPPYQGQLNDDQIKDIIEFMKTLK